MAVNYETVSYRPDTFFTLFIAGGMYLYARAVADDRPHWGLRVAAFAMLGGAMLSKGPLGLLLPGLVLTLWHISRKEWRRFLELAPLAVVSFAIYMAWFVQCANAMGADSILYELYAQNFARFASGFRGHEQPATYYLVKIWPNLAPWSPLLPFAIYWLVKSGRWRDRNVQLCMWWLGAFFVFLSTAVTKRALYMLPAFPAAALMLGPYLAAVGRAGAGDRQAPDPRPVRVYAAALGLLFLLLGLLSFLPAVAFDTLASRLDRLDELELAVARDAQVPLAAMGLAFLCFGLSFLHAWRRSDVRAALVRFGVAFLALYVLAFAWLLPTFSPTKSYRPQCEWIRAEIGDADEIGLVSPKWAYRKMGAFGFYTGARVRRMETRDEIAAFFRDHPGSVVLIERDLTEGLFAGDGPAWRDRIVRELRAGSLVYTVVRAP
jgi:4-amino-4-deoxy-L-arabinose transferase-like glycosyltransferase